jgi:hypothetical protein
MAYHYFVSTAWNWVALENLQDALKKLRSLSKDKYSEVVLYNVFKVDCDVKTPYKINNYGPVIDSSKFIEQGQFKFEKGLTK